MKTIGIFKSNCPEGWTRLSEWDGKFMRGYASYGDTGGTTQHFHTVNYPSKTTGEGTDRAVIYTGVNSPRRFYVPVEHTHLVDVSEGVSGNANNIPPCIDVVFCYSET
jgi:hypothetical protein